MSIRRHVVLIAILAAASIARGQSLIPWEHSLEAALAKAKEQGRPLLISMHTSTEVACQRMLENLYTDPEVAAVLNEFVVLPTCFDLHADVEREVDGKKVMVSPLFGSIDAKTLKTSEAAVREHFFDNNEVKVPQHVFVGDDGAIYSSKIYELKKPQFLELLRNALLQYGDKATDGMDVVTKSFLETTRSGSMTEKRKAVKGILDMQNERKLDILYLTIEAIRKDKEKGECVRAFGGDRYAWAAPRAVKWLRDPSEHVRHCAVVTVEEMATTEARDDLLRLYEKEKDKELKKDILRAMGPCCDRDERAKEILVKHVKDRRESTRIASYLSLGYYLTDTAIQDILKQQYKKEGKSVAAKTAILWAYAHARDEELIPQMMELVAKEKNKQLEYIASAAERMIKTGQAVDPAASISEHIKMHHALGVILGKDKIVRNRHKYYKGDD